MRRFLATFQDLLLALAILLAADVALFHRGHYFPLVAPKSFAGFAELKNWWFRWSVQAQPGARRILLLGDSTVDRGLHEGRVRRQLVRGRGRDVQVLNLGHPGCPPVSWYYLLKNLDLSARNTTVVVFASRLERLRCCFPLKNEIRNFKTRLGAGDMLELAWHFPDLESRLAAATGAVFRTPLFREDLREFLLAPDVRLQSLAEQESLRERMRSGRHQPRMLRRDLSAVVLEGGAAASGQPVDPRWQRNPELLRRIRRRLEALETDEPSPSAGPWALDPLIAGYLADAVRLLSSRGVTSMIAVLPDGPFSLEPRQTEPIRRFVRGLQAEGNDVDLYCDEALLDLLTEPRYFADLLHMNQDGALVYSERLGQALDELLRARPAVPRAERP